MVSKCIFCHIWYCYQIQWPFLGPKIFFSVFVYDFLFNFSPPWSPDTTQSKEFDCIWLYFPFRISYAPCITWPYSLTTFMNIFFLSPFVLPTFQVLKLVTHKPISAIMPCHTICTQYSTKRIIPFLFQTNSMSQSTSLTNWYHHSSCYANSGVTFE